MTIADIFLKVIDETLTYEEAVQKLIENKAIDPEDLDKYIRKLQKLCGKQPKELWEKYQLSGIPNQLYITLLGDTIKAIREGSNTSDIAQWIYNTYRLNGILIQYFINEALHIVRMNSITEEEFNLMGQKYMDIIAKLSGINLKKLKNTTVKMEDEINAQEITNIKETEDGFEYNSED